MELMKDMEDLYILGNPIQTDYGVLRPIKVKEYKEFINYHPLLVNSELKMKQIMLELGFKTTDNKEIMKDIRNRIKEDDFTSLVHENFQGFKDMYLEMFEFLYIDFDEDNLYRIMKNDEIWSKNRKKILLFNGIVTEDKTSNPEIEYYNNLRRELDRARGNTVNFESVYTSLIAFTGMNQQEINDLTLYAFYSIFHRINKFKNYDTSIQFKTIDYENKINVESWHQPKEYHDDDDLMSKEELLNLSKELK